MATRTRERKGAPDPGSDIDLDRIIRRKRVFLPKAVVVLGLILIPILLATTTVLGYTLFKSPKLGLTPLERTLAEPRTPPRTEPSGHIVVTKKLHLPSPPWCSVITTTQGDGSYGSVINPQGNINLLDPALNASGTGNIGQSRIQVSEPGTYTYDYWIKTTDLYDLRSLQAFIFPEDAISDGMVTRNEMLAHQMYPFDATYPMTMTFDLPKSGKYRIGFGPANGSTLDSRLATKSLELRFKLDGPGKVEWIDMESPVDFVFLMSPKETMVWQNTAKLALYQRVQKLLGEKPIEE